MTAPEASWETVVAQAATCRQCDLWRNATQTVFGEGPVPAEVMLVGEQPGDAEDRAGHPFVGPAGKVLDDALKQVGLARERIYVTNAVKHFKWTPRGKRRIHERPNRQEVAACSTWMASELALVRPRLLVFLGATAAQSLLGSTFRVTQHRGELLESDLAEIVTATVHPSSILRGPPDERDAAFAAFCADLSVAAGALKPRSGVPVFGIPNGGTPE